MKETFRCFVALDISEKCKKELKAVQEELKKQDLFIGKCTEPENIHLTLKFLGEIEKEKVQNIAEKLREVKCEPFQGSLTKLGVFSEQFIRIIWTKIEGKEVYELQKQIDRVLRESFPKEQRFMGHITIARVKQVKNKEKLLKVLKDININQQWNVDRFILKKSVLSAAGPTYQDLETYRLE
ncbi:MAG: RNA 2',3'-cyclic phosphodiesterase [Nanoarchaeota archaeon]